MIISIEFYIKWWMLQLKDLKYYDLSLDAKMKDYSYIE